MDKYAAAPEHKLLAIRGGVHTLMVSVAKESLRNGVSTVEILEEMEAGFQSAQEEVLSWRQVSTLWGVLISDVPGVEEKAPSGQ